MSQAQVQILVKLKDALSAPLRGIMGATRSFTTGLSGLFQTLQRHWLAVLAAFAALRGVINIFKDVTRAAQEQERAVTSLNAALAAQGQFTQETSAALQQYATDLQLLTGIGDEATLGVMTQIEALSGLSAQALPDAIRATVQLANVTGMEFEAAGKLMQKTLSSSTNALSRYGVEIDTAGTAQEKLNQVIEKTAAGWDIAIAKARTFEGRVKILASVWGDFKEVIGANITQSAALNELMTQLTQTIFNQTKQLVQHGEQGVNVFDMLVKGAVNMVAGILKALIYIKTGVQTLIIVGKAAVTAFKGVASGIISLVLQAWQAGVRGVAAYVNAIIDLVNAATGAISKLPGVTIAKVGHVSASIGALDSAVMSMKGSVNDAVGEWSSLGYELDSIGTNANIALFEIDRINNAVQNTKSQVVDYTNANKGLADSLNDVAGSGGKAGKAIKDLVEQYKHASVVMMETPGAMNILKYVPRKPVSRDIIAGEQTIALHQAMLREMFGEGGKFERSGAFDAIIAERKQREEAIRQMRDMGFAMADIVDLLGKHGLAGALEMATNQFSQRKTGFGQKLNIGIADFLTQLAGATAGGGNFAQAASNILGQGAGGAIGSAIGGLFGGTTTGGLMGMIGGAGGPLAMVLGSLFGGGLSKLFGGLFGGNKKPEPVEVRGKVEIINIEDLALVMLGISKRARIAGGAPVMVERMNDVSRNAARLGYAT